MAILSDSEMDRVRSSVQPKRPRKRRTVEEAQGPVVTPTGLDRISEPGLTKNHLVSPTFDWDGLRKLMRQNSAHGVQRSQYEVKIQPVSGRELRRRIHDLGFNLTEFARRHALSPSKLYGITHAPAGLILTQYIRLVEFEEFLLGIAKILEADDLNEAGIREQLTVMLEDQAARL